MSFLTEAVSEISSRNRWVYVVRAGRFVKIGISGNVNKRIMGIQTGSPLKVRLIRQWVTPYASKIEWLAHKALAKYRLSGEWFDVPTQAAVLTVSSLVQANPRNPRAKVNLEKTVLFCRGCQHCGVLKLKVEPNSRFKCSACGSVEQVHAVAF